jgi:hypothetical protein
MRKVFLGGEGKHELGSWALEPQYRSPSFPGVLEALLLKVRAEGWEVVGARPWRSIRKYQAGQHRSAERRSVLGLILDAKEAGCDVVVFVRDRDGSRAKPNQARVDAIEDAIAEAAEQLTACPDIIGGVAVIRLESWMLALTGVVGTEEERAPEERLRELGIKPKRTRSYVEHIHDADLQRIPGDAASLRRWIERAQIALLKGTF